MSVNKHIIEVQTRGANKSKKQINGVSNGLKNMAKQAAIAAGSYFGARMLLDAVKTSIDLFAKQELAEKKLEAVLKSTKQAAGLTSRELTNMASALQRVTTFGDEAIIEAQALMLTFTKIGKEVMPDTIETVLNMSEAMGVGLKEQVIQLGKALNDPITGVTALQRVGVTLSDTQKKQIKDFMEVNDVASAQGVILGELETQFGGAARAAADTLSGSLKQLSNAFGDLQEELGSTFADEIETTTTTVTDFLTTITTNLKLNQLEAQLTSGAYQNMSTQAKIAFEEQTKALLESQIQFEKTNPFVSKLIDGLKNVGENADAFLPAPAKALLQLSDSLGLTTEVTEDFFQVNEEKVGEYQNSIDESDARIQKLKESIVELNDVNKTSTEIIEDNTEALEIKKKAEEAASLAMEQSARQAVSDLQVIAQEYPKAQKVAKAAAIGQTIFDTYRSAQGAYTSFATSPQAATNPILYQALGIAAASTAVVAGLARVQSIRKAQYGADFVTDGPQMMMVGEGSGPERVQVTPLSDPNIDGPQGQGITLNIQGNVLHESFVEDNIIPQIREGLRLGENMGI
tara:strand:+ start:1582 stop:3300 length:1719 start_codon:yes stop_codon:yes gene_type:complete